MIRTNEEANKTVCPFMSRPMFVAQNVSQPAAVVLGGPTKATHLKVDLMRVPCLGNKCAAWVEIAGEDTGYCTILQGYLEMAHTR